MNPLKTQFSPAHGTGRSQREVKHKKDLMYHCWLEDGGTTWGERQVPSRNEKRPWRTARKNTRTSVLQPQGTWFCQKPEWTWKQILLRSLQVRAQADQHLPGLLTYRTLEITNECRFKLLSFSWGFTKKYETNTWQKGRNSSLYSIAPQQHSLAPKIYTSGKCIFLISKDQTCTQWVLGLKVVITQSLEYLSQLVKTLQVFFLYNEFL